MKKALAILVLIVATATYLLHRNELLDDLPHLAKVYSQPVHERPIHHFYYGLSSGQMLFTGLALDKAARDKFNEANNMSAEDSEKITQFLQHATCQMEYEIIDSIRQEDSATITLRINTVPPAKLLANLTKSTLGNLFTKGAQEKIMANFQQEGCTGKRKEFDQTIELRKEEGEWKICTECTEKIVMVEVIEQIIRFSIK